VVVEDFLEDVFDAFFASDFSRIEFVDVVVGMVKQDTCDGGFADATGSIEEGDWGWTGRRLCCGCTVPLTGFTSIRTPLYVRQPLAQYPDGSGMTGNVTGDSGVVFLEPLLGHWGIG